MTDVLVTMNSIQQPSCIQRIGRTQTRHAGHWLRPVPLCTSLLLLAATVSQAADTVKPTLTITSPTPGARLTNAVISASRTARDNVQVSAVRYRFNTDAWATAAGTTNWTTPSLSLLPGTNTLSAYAVDSCDNLSRT